MSESALQEYAVRVGSYPAYIYDLPGLAEHAAAIRAALPGTEIFYAAKANPDAEILRTLAPHVDGVEVSSGGELDHVRTTLPGMPVAFGGPGKTDRGTVAGAAARGGADPRREPAASSPACARRPADVLLRANLPLATPGAALSMSGPFGMDPRTTSANARAGSPQRPASSSAASMPISRPAWTPRQCSTWPTG